MQIEADKVKQLIERASQVVIMAHRNLDLDALGSSLGVYYLCEALGKDTCLLIEDNNYEAGVKRSLEGIKKQELNVKIRNYSEIKDKIDSDTLLIVLDTSVDELLQSKEALAIGRVIVIDHHIPADNQSISSLYEYISNEQSSSVEIIIDLLKYLDIYIPSYIATIMLSGMFVDTNGFFNSTNYKTHEGAAYLYKCEASLKELQYLLKEDIKRYNDRQKVIEEAKTIDNHFIIALGHENHIYNKEDLAKISDTMLLFNNIEASFTIGMIDDKTIGISARSLGNVNVQEIMEKLGGGGHLSDAATQLRSNNLIDAKDKLIKVINSRG